MDAAIAAGFVLAGCSDRALRDSHGEGSDGADGSTTGGGGSTSGGLPTTGTEPTGTVDSSAPDDDAGLDSGPLFDVGARYDIGPPATDLGMLDCDVAPALPTAGCDTIGEDVAIAVSCIEPTDGRPCPAPGAAVFDDCLGCGGELLTETCGPALNEVDACCYWAHIEPGFCPGRPFVVDGRARLAPVVADDGWIEDSEVTRHDRAIAAAWLHDARTEHAAIASFSRFALQLLAMAAPARFVAAAHRAAIDELEHARLFFTMATRNGAAPSGPGALAVAGALAASDDPTAMVVATVREGCIAETISLLQLARVCECVDDPWLRTRLQRVLAEELTHVELAWSFVAWALATGDASRHAAVRAAFDAAAWCIPCGAEVEPAPDDRDRWRRAGRLAVAERLAIARAAIDQIVRPAAAAMLGSGEPPGTQVGETPRTRPHRGGLC